MLPSSEDITSHVRHSHRSSTIRGPENVPQTYFAIILPYCLWVHIHEQTSNYPVREDLFKDAFSIFTFDVRYSITHMTILLPYCIIIITILIIVWLILLLLECNWWQKSHSLINCNLSLDYKLSLFRDLAEIIKSSYIIWFCFLVSILLVCLVTNQNPTHIKHLI